ncbi:hypothetical protein AgCh_019899 [Apium graveolens]
MEARRSPRLQILRSSSKGKVVELVAYTDSESTDEDIMKEVPKEDQHNNKRRDKDSCMEENVTMPPVKWKKARTKRPQLSPFREVEDKSMDDNRDENTTEQTTVDEEGAHEKIKTNCRKENDNQKKAVIRNSPRLFSEVVFHLSDDKKKWVENSGFGELFDFDLEMIPSKLSSKIVQAFDHKSVMIEIEK